MTPWSPHLHQHPASERPTLALIELAYAAAAEPTLWPRWFEDLASKLDHRRSNVVLHGFGPTRYVSLETPETGFTLLNPSHIFKTKALSRHSFSIAWVADEIVDEWSQLPREGSLQKGIEVFTDASRALRPADRTLLRTVLPHLHRALTLHFRLEAARREQDTFGACLDEFCTGMMLLDGDGAVHHANRAALDYLDGPCSVVQDDGKIRVIDRDIDACFRARLTTAMTDSQRSLACIKLSCGATLWLRALGSDRAVAYISSDQQQRSMEPELLADAFELSPAEARVGSLFALGHGVDEIAATLAISIHTVRLHIKNMQHKTGTHRQVTLLRRVLETVPLVNP